jgi:hypothetical protein
MSIIEAEYLKKYFEERNIFLATFISPPEKLSKSSEDFTATERYYTVIISADNEDGITVIIHHIVDTSQYLPHSLPSGVKITTTLKP